MCLLVDINTKIETAKEDITVYKVILASDKSLYKYFHYTPKTLFRLRQALEIKWSRGDLVVNEGFHSYKYKKDAIKEYRLRLGHITHKIKVVEFVIPKGAKYVVGKFENKQNYVSTSIRSGNLRNDSIIRE